MGRRVVAVIALLCQLATTAHVPLVHADTAGNAPAPLEHCAHHAQPDATPGVQPDGRSPHHRGHAGHTGYCCGGQCTCAQAVALLCTVPESPCPAPLPVILSYRVPDMPQLDTVFFRPPI